MNKYIITLLLVVVTLASCGEYQKLLKSTDVELKYKKAVEYFDKRDYVRAATLFDAIASYYKGTERSEYVLNYLAKSYVGQKDYVTASDYYSTYVKTYPKGQFIMEAKFMIGYCYYLDSPDPRLDQTATNSALSAFYEYSELYPESERIQEVNKYIDELTNKLAFKEYLNAKLYFNLGNYGGNNFESAVICAQNALKDFPSTKYREQFSMLILESKYELALMSVESKKMDRYRNTIDEYYNFINEFPDSKMRKKAEKIFNECSRVTKDN